MKFKKNGKGSTQLWDLISFVSSSAKKRMGL